MSEIDGMDRLSDALDSFRCCQDEDIEMFLRQKAFSFLKRKWCAIYLILDEQAFDNGKVEVLAYFTLSHKAFSTPIEISKSVVQDTAGFKDASILHFVLIGQLGKYVEQKSDGTYIRSDISGREVLDYAFEIIRASSNLIPCRCALVECNEREKVHKFYTDNGFTYFQHDGEHDQFYKRI